MNPSACHILAMGVGVASHILYFNRYEFHRQLNTVLFSFFIAAVSCLWTSIKILDVCKGAIATSQIIFCFLTGAIGSTIIYRLFFNPLNRFPGPFFARLSDFWMAAHVGKDLDQWKKLDALHKKYGPYVRIGANQLSVVDARLVEPAYAGCQKSNVRKAGWYDFDWPSRSLLAERTFHGHSQRRHLWAPAFSDKALHQYETKVTEFNDKFLERVKSVQSQQGCINVSELFGLYSFDVMGSLVFGENYGMLETNKKHHAFELLTEGLSILGMSLPIWFILLLKTVPWELGGAGDFNSFLDSQVERSVKTRKFSVDAVRKLSTVVRRLSMKTIPKTFVRRESFCGRQAERTAQRKKFDAFSDTQVQQAVQRRRSVVQGKADPSTEDQRSILYWVLKTYGDRDHLENDTFLRTDARLLIVAGSDTTATALTYLFFLLSTRPAEVQKIRDEIKGCIKEGREWVEKDIRYCHHLNGAINEALRLHPPGPSGVHRTTPAEGLLVGGEVFIPGGTNFQIPFSTLYRDENIYEHADFFIPERWYSRPELVKQPKTFVPFLAGPYSCLGKNLALIEMRTLTARILLEFDVSLASHEDGSRLLYDSRDHFTMSLAPLDLVFTPIRGKEDDGFDSLGDLRAGGARWNFANGLRRQSCIVRETIPEEAPEEAMQSWHW